MTDRERASADGIYYLGEGKFKARKGQLLPPGARFVRVREETTSFSGAPENMQGGPAPEVVTTVLGPDGQSVIGQGDQSQFHPEGGTAGDDQGREEKPVEEPQTKEQKASSSSSDSSRNKETNSAEKHSEKNK